MCWVRKLPLMSCCLWFFRFVALSSCLALIRTKQRKTEMKFSIKSRILKVGAITFTGLTVVISAQAYSDNDLILGFTTATSTGDLVVNLGQPAAVGVGGSTTVD